ncbi:MAG: YqgE/AlgH family protein [Bacteroidetes bacterium]|nr:YqgE/AlgH family protein [Bacteroidota bacterium]
MIKAGDILIAKPFLQDGHFKRSVIYICEHTADGSLGFIINKSHGLLLRDIFPHLKNGNFPLFEGGPVSPNQLFYTHTLGSKISDSQHITGDIYWGGNFFELSELIERGEVSSHQIRFYIGYSGWGEEQLSGELENDMWFEKTVDYHQLMSVHPDELWGEELVKINPGYKAFADFSYDPSLN